MTFILKLPPQLRTLFLLAVLVLCNQFAQAQGGTLIINTPQAAGSYAARQRVQLKAGSKIVPNSRLYIDKNVIHNIQYSEDPNLGFDSNAPYIIDKTLAVGVIQGQAGVGAMGQATYSLPLITPSATAGGNVALSINYTGGGSGNMGIGWAMSGLHTITRGGKNQHDDWKTTGVDLSLNDELFLDGNRLILTNGNPNSADAILEYTTQNEQFAVIKAHRSGVLKIVDEVYSGGTVTHPTVDTYDNMTIDWFEVTFKDGTRMELGNSDNSKLVSESAPLFTYVEKNVGIGFGNSFWFQKKMSPLYNNAQWYVSSIADKQGNTITYEYNKDVLTEFQVPFQPIGDNPNGYYTTYKNTANEKYLKHIYYTANTGANITAQNQVNFYYDYTKFPTKGNIGNKLVENNFLLSQVEMLVQGQHNHTYSFTYNTNSVFEFLVQVDEDNSNHEKLNPTIFNYEKPSTTTPSYSASTDVYNVRNKQQLFIDVNDDGYKDLINIGKAVGNGGNIPEDYSIILNDKQGNFPLSTIQNKGYSIPRLVRFSLVGSPEASSVSNLSNNISQGDFNGDGRIDLLMAYSYLQNQSLSNSNNATASDFFDIDVKLLLNQGNGSFTEKLVATIPSVYSKGTLDFFENPPSSGLSTVFVGSRRVGFMSLATDLNSDGVSEVLLMVTNSNSGTQKFKTYHYALDNSQSPYIIAYNDYDKIINFNHVSLHTDNAKQSVVGFINESNSPQTLMYLTSFGANATLRDDIDFDSGGSIKSGLAAIQGVTDIEPSFNIDINGDGFNDKIAFNNINARQASITLNGYASNSYKNFIIPFTFNGWAITPDERLDRLFPVDMNGDGKQDIVTVVNNIGSNDAYLTVHYSNGESFPTASTFTFTATNFTNQWLFNFEDLNNDGLLEVILTFNGSIKLFLPATSKVHHVVFPDQLAQYSLSKVTNGMGIESKFVYANLATPYDNFSYSRTNYSYPNLPFYAGIKTVKQLQTSNGIGGYFTQQYDFTNPIINLQGKGFLGFAKTIVTNVDMATRVTATPFLNGYIPALLPEVTTTQGNVFGTPTMLSTSYTGYTATYIAGYNPLGNIVPKSLLLQVNSSTQNNHLSNTSTTSTTTYDAYGNATNTTTNYNGVEQQTTAVVYNPTITNTVPYLPASVTTTITRNGGSNSNLTEYTYYPTTHLLINKTTDANYASKALVHSFDYTPTGLINAYQITNQYENDPLKSGFLTYDPTQTYTLKQHDIVSASTQHTLQTTTTQYNTLLGVPTKTTNNVTNLKNTATYDAWARPTTSTDALNVTSTLTYNWLTTPINVPPLNVSTAVYSTTTTTPNSPVVVQYYDVLGRKVLVQTKGYNGQDIYQATEYNALGQAIKTTNAYDPNDANTVPIITTMLYDALQRPKETQSSDAQGTTLKTKTAYTFANGNSTVTTTAPDNTVTSQTKDAAGKLITSTDNGGTLDYAYGYNTSNNHSTVSTTVNGTLKTTAEFNEVGQQISLIDQAAGTSTYTYNAFNWLMTQIDGQGNTYTFDYYADGRIKTKTNTADGVYTYLYEDTPNGINQLKSISHPSKGTVSYAYNALQQLTTSTETNVLPTANRSYTTQYTYTQYGDVENTVYPLGYTIQNKYDAQGNLTQIKDLAANSTLWQGNTANAAGQVTSYTLGNGLTSTRAFTAFGLPTTFTTPTVQDLTLDFNPTNHNLLSRTNNGLQENFKYDNLDRLTRYTSPWDALISSKTPYLAYNNEGQITTKQDAGTYNYTGQKLDNITPNTLPATPLLAVDISYNAFKRPSVLYSDPANANGSGYKITYNYGVTQERSMATYELNGTLQARRYYNTNYEVNEKYNATGQVTYSNQVHYIHAPTGLCAMYVVENDLTAGTTTSETHYVYTDHLGSLVAVTNSIGYIDARQEFDPWGRRRDPGTLDYLPTGSNGDLPLWLTRGYTGHEMLDEVGLIHMNARLYDPISGTMLAPDDYVSDATSTQGYSRYVYCANNPLKYTDPDGNNPELLIAVGIAALIGGTVNVATNWNNINDFGQGAAYFGVGAVAGAVSVFGAPFGGMVAGGGNAALGSYYNTGHVDGGAVIQGMVMGGIIAGATQMAREGIIYGFSSSSLVEASEGRALGAQKALGLANFDDPTSTSASDDYLEASIEGPRRRYNLAKKSGVGLGTQKTTVPKPASVSTVGQAGYQLADVFGQVLNVGGVVYGGAEMGIQAVRQGNGAQNIGRAIGFGTQQTAQALRGTLGVVSKVGKGFGVAGYGLQVGTILYKTGNSIPISTAEGVGLGVSTVLIGAAYFAAGTAAAPFVATGALIYGATQLGSYIFTGQTVEEHIFGK